ncbi:MAG: Rpn family recombination-promoting nuclease/putative transposase, partial [Saprospiraceae bacterium]|nr:Rpn family recombination-promoting nuclease/putative transposase [Saprospiraceae bacterium]
MEKITFSSLFPHDRYLRLVLQVVLVVREVLEAFLPADQLALLNLDTLKLSSESYISEDLKESVSDIVYTCETKDGKPVRICLLFEHKSTSTGRHIYVQLGRYLFNIQEKDIRQGLEYFTLTIPVLIYHGEQPWELPPLREQYGQITKELEGYIPHFDIVFVNIQALSDESIERMQQFQLLRNVLLALKHARDNEYVRVYFRRLLIFVSENADEEVLMHLSEATFVYLQQSSTLSKEEIMNLIQTLPPPLEQRAKTTYEQILEEGIEKGIQKGIEIGREEGIEIGREEGIEIGREEGIEIGREEGIEIGREEG